MVWCANLWHDPGPDTGWSWVVAFSCCWITTGMYGIVRSSGFLYVAVIENFGVSRKEAALPFAVMLSFSNFIGLCGSILLQFCSMRQIVIGGSALGCLGVTLSYFAKSVHWITFFIGVLTGSGIGLSTSLLTVLLSQYFVKARTTANGIWLAGRSISGFLFPPLIFVLLTTFGLRGTFLILGGILSNTLIGAAFLRPRTPTHFPLKLGRTLDETKTMLSSSPAGHSNGEIESLRLKKTPNKKWLKLSTTSDETTMLPLGSSGHSNGQIDSVRSRTHAEIPLKLARSSGETRSIIPPDSAIHSNGEILKNSFHSPPEENGMNSHESDYDVLSPNKSKPLQHQNGTFLEKCSKFLKTSCGLFRNPVYILNIFTDSYHAFTITATGMTMVDFSLDNGFSMNYALMVLLALNISDLVARIFTGFISDRGYLSRPTLIAFTLCMSGAALFMLTLVDSKYLFLLLCALYGTMMGCAIINIVAFYTEYMAQEELPIGIGVGNFIKGFIFLLQSVLIGYFRDEVGSYIYLYYFFAFLAPVLGCFWVLVQLVHKCRHRDITEHNIERTTSC